jgi:hypothetical protein
MIDRFPVEISHGVGIEDYTEICDICGRTAKWRVDDLKVCDLCKVEVMEDLGIDEEDVRIA